MVPADWACKFRGGARHARRTCRDFVAQGRLLQSAQEHLASLGIDASWIAADNGSEDDIERLANEAMSRLGRVDILVNNAGATWGATMADHPLAAWDKLMNLNVRSIFLLSRKIGRLSMIPNRYGRIINLASIAGLKGNGPKAQPTIAYNISKGAVVNVTRALAVIGRRKCARLSRSG